jgi:protein-disulfide isomerase
MWFSLAATQKQKNAVKYRDFLVSRMTAADASKAEQLARDWLAKHQQ